MISRLSSVFLASVTFAVVFSIPLTAPAQPALASSFGLEQVMAKAKKLSERSYSKPKEIPKKFRSLSFSQWDSIRFKPSFELWPGGNFSIRFRSAGYLYKYAVKFNVVNTEGVQPINFSPFMFKYKKKKLGTNLPKHLGFAGFQILYPLKPLRYMVHSRKANKSNKSISSSNKKIKKNEFISFLGATYFRARAAGQVFGLSARGLAVNTATSSGEEFPYFREYWLARPAKTSHHIIVYALLDSPSITGAYRFAIRPGSPTKVTVKAVLYPRHKIKKLGLAPLTSMFLYSQGQKRPKGYLYSAVHDSNGLLIYKHNKQWIWRPLMDPSSLSDNYFYIKSPRGFGLMQRNRQPNQYPSIPSPYAYRPSAWVKPIGNWGKGHIELVEIPSPNQNNDNIVAFWVPKTAPPAHKPFRVKYTIDWQGENPQLPPLGHVISTRSNVTKSKKTTRRFAVDFKGGTLQKINTTNHVKSVIKGGKNGNITHSKLTYDKYTHTWRLIFSVADKNGKNTELKAFLEKNNKALLTWFEPIILRGRTTQGWVRVVRFAES